MPFVAPTLNTAAFSSVLLPIFKFTVSDASAPSSPMLPAPAANSTVAASASCIVTRLMLLVPTVAPPLLADRTRTSSSSPSTSVSEAGFKEIDWLAVPLSLPAANVTVWAKLPES